MTGPSGAESLVGTLAAEGVTHFFGVPGEQCLGIVDAVARRDDLRFVSTRHESGAAFMAEAYGKLTGRPAACIGTASVGGLNLAGGVNVAHHDSTPMITLIGQVSTANRGREAWQEIELRDVYAPICRFAEEIEHPDKITEVTRRAVAMAKAGRPGPVMMSVPEDVQSAPGPEIPVTASPVYPSAVQEQAVFEVVELLKAALRPVLVVGGGIRASQAREDLVRFAESQQLPVATAFRRMDAFPNDSEHWVGALGLSASERTKQIMRDADLIIAIGTRLAEITTDKYAFPTPAQRTVHIDADPHVLAAHWAPADVRITADARLAIQALHVACERSGLRRTERWWTGRSSPEAEVSGEQAVIRQVAGEIDLLLPDDAVVTSDAGDFFLGCGPMIKFRQDRRYLGPTSGTMGYGLPSAIAAKLAAPDRACVALCGDGGLMMTVQELETAVRYDIPVVVVVFNNNAYGSIVRHQQNRCEGRVVGTALNNPPFAELADLFGARGTSVSAPAEFAVAFKRALESDRVELLEVRL